MRSLRRGAVVLTFAVGLVVGFGHPDRPVPGKLVERAQASRVTSVRAPAGPLIRPRSTSPPDVRSALLALSHILAVMFPPTTAPAPVAASIEAPEPEQALEPGRCGGDLPPCYVLERESHGNPYAVEPGHQGAPYGDPGDPMHHASGLWQFIPSTWARFGGYPYAAAAPVSVQNEKARLLWAGGAGCGHWSTC